MAAPDVERLPGGVDGFVVRGVLTPDECARWVEAVRDAAGFHRPGTDAAGRWHAFAGDRRRATVTDPAMAARVWAAVAPHVAPVAFDPAAGRHSFSGHREVLGGLYAPEGVSDFFRVSEYVPGGSFGSHVDTCHGFGPARAGMHTVLLYLGRCEGGETQFLGAGGEVLASVTPEPGTVLVFHHHQLHAGARVTGGTKHVARTEVVFAKK